jgi:hypothetical protein
VRWTWNQAGAWKRRPGSWERVCKRIPTFFVPLFVLVHLLIFKTIAALPENSACRAIA